MILSFRAADEDAAEVKRWADALGVDRSELLRDALQRHLVYLRAQHGVLVWQDTPPTEAEPSLGTVADWGPEEDWSDWAEASR